MRSVRAIVCAAVVLAALGTGPSAWLGAGPSAWLGAGPSAWLGAGPSASAVEPLENVLPKETVVFVSVRNVPQLLEKAKQLPAYKILIEQGLLEKVVPGEKLTEARAIYERFCEPLGELLPGQVAFALLKLGETEGFPPVAFLADVGSTEVAFKLYLEQTIYPWLEEDGAKPEELRIGTAAVTRFAVPEEPDKELFLTVDEGVFVATTQKEAMETIVGALGGTGGENLAGNEGFSAAQPTLAGADVAAYVNIAAFIEKARGRSWIHAHKVRVRDEAEGDIEAVEPEDESWSREVQFDKHWARIEALTGLGQKTFRGVAVGITLGPEGIVTTARVSAPGAAGGLLDILAREAPPLKSVEYVPQDAAGFAAVSLGSFSQVHEDFVAALKAYGKLPFFEDFLDPLEIFQGSEAELEELLKMDVEEKLLPALGGEVALVGWMPEGLTVPPAAALIEIKDAAVVRELVARLLEIIEEREGEAVKATTANVGGVEVTSVEGVPKVTQAVAIVAIFVVATSPALSSRSRASRRASRTWQAQPATSAAWRPSRPRHGDGVCGPEAGG